MSASRDTSIASISPLTSENYCLWADDIKPWLQLNGLWQLVSGSEKKPTGKPKVLDSKGNVLTAAMPPDEDKLERWEVKAERAAGALKIAMSYELRVLIRGCEDDPIAIWDTLKANFKDDSKSLESLINKVDEQIRVIKSLSPPSFTLDNLYNKLAVMVIIRALPQSFDEVVHTILVLDKFDKQSVIQSLRNMDQTHSNLSGTSSPFSATSAPSKSCSKASTTNPPFLFLQGVLVIQQANKAEMVTQTNDLLQEIGRDVSTAALGYGHFYLKEAVKLQVGSTIPATADDFNDSLGMVLNALDIGVDEDIEHRGLVPSSWYRVTTAVLAAKTLADIGIWRQQYQQMLLQALKEDALGPALAPIMDSQLLRDHADIIQMQIEGCVAELRDSVIRGELHKVLKTEELKRVRAEVWLKKNWSVAYWDSVKLDFLKRMADELVYLVVVKDSDEEHEGQSRKRMIPDSKRSCSTSRVEDITPQTVPVTPMTRSRKLDQSITPTPKKKMKGKGRAIIIPKPFKRASSVATDHEDEMETEPLPAPFPLVNPISAIPISAITVPQDVRSSQQLEAPLHDPVLDHVDVLPSPSSLFPPLPTAPVAVGAVPSEVSSDDSLCGVQSSLHNPMNRMDEGSDAPSDVPQAPIPTPAPTSTPASGEAIVPALPTMSIPVLPGLAEMLQALQSNLVTTFTTQIVVLSRRIDN
ncbi:hypothetical protein BJY52DRAFT_1191926 [Lactarius psammicola]|nr:hypothetical protein BJY52DRAFT_1191926 [Lactarius psammicola]